jgi:NAD(P)-dependent dehydrogenase (short-subunit alcohol dehydrogenase family)
MSSQTSAKPLLADKVAIITGAGQGIGLGIAQAFAKEGARLVITGRDQAKLERAAAELQALGAEVLVVAGDARRRDDADKTVAATIAHFGRVDILVNNAQSSTPGVPLEKVDDDTFAMTLESGLMGTFYFMQAVFPHMKAQNDGVIVNFGSATGIEGSRGFAPYAATKEAIRGLSRVAAREWGRHNIRVNVICPAAMSPAAATYLDNHPEHRKKLEAEIPLGRMGDNETDVGRFVLVLVSEHSRYITGQTINVDGGQIML